MIRKLLKQVSIFLPDDYYNICIADDHKCLHSTFRRIVAHSRKYLYLSCGSHSPILLRDEFRDVILDKICAREPRLELKVLIREKLFSNLSYYDASFRTTRSYIPDYVTGDAGTMVVIPHGWNFCKIRDEYPGEDIKRKFLAAYNTAQTS